MSPVLFRRLLRWGAWLALVAGILCAVVAIVYFVTPARDLPIILGQIKTSQHRTRRAIAWAILAGTLLIVSVSVRAASRPKQFLD